MKNSQFLLNFTSLLAFLLIIETPCSFARGGGFHGQAHFNANFSHANHMSVSHVHAVHMNAIHTNVGHVHTGHINASHVNPVHRNSGHINASHVNPGHINAGHINASHVNPGNINAGHINASHLNRVHPGALSNVRNKNVNAFTHRNLMMNPHRGIPTNAFNKMNAAHNNFLKQNWTGRNLANTNWHNNWNNNWHNWNGWRNSGWGHWNNHWWGNGWFYASVFGGAFIYPYWFWYQPYYVYTPIYYDYYPAYNVYYYPQAKKYSGNSNSVYTKTTKSPQIKKSDTVVSENNNATLPDNETWIAAKNGDVPKNGVINTNDNGKLTYYCRAKYGNKLNYGVLVPNDGCYVENESVTMRFTSYDALITK